MDPPIDFILEEEQISYIDLAPEFRNSSQKLYFNKDGHWTKEGHRLAAQIIVDRMTEK